MRQSGKIRSFKLIRFCEPLEEVIAERPNPAGREVLLKVDACGVCHSDVHMSLGYFDLGHGRRMDMSRGIQLPRTLGHEIVGTVVAVGPDAKGVNIGDRRVVYPWGGCGKCALCKSGQEHLCPQPRSSGATLDGGFSDHVLVEKPEFLFAYDPLPAAFAATLACSGLTAYGALKKAGAVNSETPLLIIGAGGLGMSAISICKAIHGVGPIVAEIDPIKREAALKAGAARVVDPTDPGLRKDILKETGGLSAVIDFVGASATAELGLSVIRKGGKLIAVGLFGGALDLPLPTVPLRGISIVGSYVGSLTEFGELMELARAGKVSQMPLTTRPLFEAQQALDDLHAGRVFGRTVLQPHDYSAEESMTARG